MSVNAGEENRNPRHGVDNPQPCSLGPRIEAQPPYISLSAPNHISLSVFLVSSWVLSWGTTYGKSCRMGSLCSVSTQAESQEVEVRESKIPL